jgi:hypothetical protein
MRIRKTFLAMLALAIAIAFSPLPELQAATFVNPGSQPGTDNLTIDVKAKKKGKKKAKKKKGKKKGKKAKSKGPGACGTYMYYSKKKKKCVDARDPKK